MWKKVFKRSKSTELPEMLQALQSLHEQNSILQQRVNQMEHRLINYYRARWDTIDYFADYLVNAELPGDYAEFGVFQGNTFAYVAKIFAPLFPHMRFLAFDSFEGLPEPAGVDKKDDGFASGFYKGQFSCDEPSFRANVSAQSCLPPEKLLTIPGWFNESLTEHTAQNIDLQKLACVWIDCDFYESTVPVLKFITPYLSVGSIIAFDDWRCYHNLPDHGEQRACAEWLAANPQIKLNEFISFGFHGLSFTVGSC